MTPFKLNLKHLNAYLFFIFALFSTDLFADDKEEIALVLSSDNSPDGIVFELIGEDGDYLTDALERIETYKKQLRAKFPKLDIAVVSHGSEQFSLTKDKASKFKAAHTSVKRLLKSNIPVHICETHASWRDIAPEDYPDYIDVAPQGPAQIQQYEELGYELIVIE